ncbi:rhamnulose-1-phosphate aldolase [Carboxylicivirga sp. A043]|uniref:rhamnulose-1-phosphate aldolase n=1 Tax=Carboxylicivirga litoralis TaxID=2816963 RepID=UPI0021CAF651|nr:rhamnulose-1-phosphate aldolase [Carboxylicivirga sp. A043]MCU4157121.1 rhamnulose-1-phosphate aldolase [Carboxylicivirga sp. A043]
MNNLPIEVDKEIEKVSEIAGYLWEREWAERNAGNISINLTRHFKGETLSNPEREIAFDFPKEAAGLVVFVTGTGCHLRHLRNRINEVACIISINEKANAYSIVWGGTKENFRPTSELISHVKIHLFNAENKPTHTTIVHTHPIELIVMSHHALFQDEDKFNHALWKMCPEIRVFVPKGVDCTPYALSGTEALADVTIEGLKNRDVVLWEKHGALATGEDAEIAFDYLDVANKGAKLLLTSWNAGFEPVGLTDAELKELETFI